MKTERSKRLLIAGFADDVRVLVNGLRSTSTEIVQVTEDATGAQVPRNTDIVLYAVSRDTGFSTQLHSLFVYIHDHVQYEGEYLVPLSDSVSGRLPFPEMANVPSISLKDIGSAFQ